MPGANSIFLATSNWVLIMCNVEGSRVPKSHIFHLNLLFIKILKEKIQEKLKELFFLKLLGTSHQQNV